MIFQKLLISSVGADFLVIGKVVVMIQVMLRDSSKWKMSRHFQLEANMTFLGLLISVYMSTANQNKH
jgi:hypothetical protein